MNTNNAGENNADKNKQNKQFRYSSQQIWRLRNEVRMDKLLSRLQWPHKDRMGQLSFLCPRCQEYRAAVNPRTNLGRCFACETNFNPIDLTMAIEQCDFLGTLPILIPLLPKKR